MPHSSLHSPIGDITLFEEDGALVSVDWGWVDEQHQTPLLREARRQLNEYFDGKRRNFDLPVVLSGTDYQKRVWQALAAIPFGETRTYAQIAAQVGGSPRSVGQANGRNPLPLVIPCHRVVAAHGLGGYSGADGTETKSWLLAREAERASSAEANEDSRP